MTSFLLSKEPYFKADLFTFSLASGDVFRWTSTDADIVYGGNIWKSDGPTIQRSAWSLKNTTEVSELSIKLFSSGSDFSMGNIKLMIMEGLFDGGHVLFERAIMPTFGDTSLGLIEMWGGRIGTIEVDALGAVITCSSSNILMQQNVPRNTYQAGCVHTLYDSGCTLSKAAFTTIRVVTGANRLTLTYDEDPTVDPGIYSLGTVRLTSGPGAGQARSVAGSFTPGVIIVSYPLYIVPEIGDTFDLVQGCNKTMTRCTQFNNMPNFRGFPYIPPASFGL